MRKPIAFLLGLLLVSCGEFPIGWVEGPVQTVTTRARGLYTQPAPVGGVPDGALLQADNVVVTSDGTTETRRGTEIIASKVMTKLIPYRGVLVGHNRNTGLLSYSNVGGTAWTDYGTFTAPTADQIRAAALNSDLYFTSSGVPYRLDAIAGTPEPQGIADGLDAQAQFSGATGSAIQGNAQVAYRIVFGKRDANGTLILGGPSGRTTLTSPAVVIAAGSLTRATTVVTATLTAGVANPFSNGDTIYLSPGETNFPAGNKAITGVTATTFTYTEAGSAVSSTAPQQFSYPTRDASITYSLPASLPSNVFVQGYRSQPSASATATPDDELGLVYEGAVPTAKTASQLARSANVVTATTTVAHGYATGMTVRVSPGGGAGTANIMAVGSTSAAASTPDGVTWTGRTIAAGTYAAIAWNGSIFAAVGTNVAATSPDGITWTARTIPAGSYTGIAWNGSLFAAVGSAGVAATSPDGITWTARTIPTASYTGIAWSGALFAASVANNAGTEVSTSPDGITWTSRSTPVGPYNAIAWNGSLFVAIGSTLSTSPDGITWTSRTFPGAAAYFGVTWSGTAFAAVGYSSNAASSPDGITWTTRTIPAGNYRAITWGASVFVAVGDNSSAATSPDGVTWTGRTITAGSYGGVATGGTAVFPAGEKTIASTPTSTTFTYNETGADGTLVFTETLTPVTGGFLDQVPSSFIGAALYTNPGQGGMVAAAAKLWGARDVAMFRETAFYANIAYPSAADLYLLAVSDGTSGGIRANDVITIDGLTYTASTTESVSGRTFKLSTSASASTRLFETAASLIRILNRTQSNTVTARDTSSATDPGPRIHLQESNTSVTMSVTFTGDASSWSVANLTAPLQQQNELRWSSLQQPDSVPLLNVKRIGSADRPILRIVPTRNALYILKSDGVWILTGYSSPWSIDPFDPTVELIAPDSAVVLDNQIYCLTHHGVMRISDTGVTVVSRPIEDLINAVLTPAMRPTTAAYSFAVSDEHDHKFYLWVPQQTSDTQGVVGYVYDIYTEAWTARTDAMAHGLSNPADDRLYFAATAGVRQERKAFQPQDYADESYAITVNSVTGPTVVLADATNVLVGDVVAQGNIYGTAIAKATNTLTLDRSAALVAGAATSYRAISTTIRWVPKFGTDPSMFYRFREVGLLFRDLYFAQATLGYSTDWVPAWTNISLSGTNYGWATSFPTLVPTEPSPTPLSVRSWVDLEHARATQLYVRWQHAQAWAPMRVQALTSVFQPVSTRIGR